MNGFLNILKPSGLTASDVVVKARKIIGEKKIGHLGTLDPGAVGVLPLAIGKGTKLFDYLTFKTKTYRALFTFGKTTDTLDSYGVVTQSTQICPTEEEIKNVLPSFLGKQKQLPPIYSAVSVNGVRSYELARKGIETELKLKDVEIFNINYVRQYNDNTYVLDIGCSGGTYIRSIVRDIAFKLNTVGFMSGLIRLNSGIFKIEDAKTLDELKNDSNSCLLSLEYPLKNLESIILTENFYKQIANGMAIRVERNDIQFIKVYCCDEFFGLASIINGILRLVYNLR